MTTRMYLSGPMSGLPDFNYPTFRRIAADLTSRGYVVSNPADNGLPDGLSWEDYIRTDIRMLLDCDAVVVLPGWETSRGASLEVTIARALGMPVIALDDLP